MATLAVKCMKPLAILFTLIMLSACDPYWNVKREMPLSSADNNCIREAIQVTEGVKGVVQLKVGQSYTLTGENLPKPIVFQFETDLENGFVEFHEGKVTAYFGGIGSRVPSEIAAQGPRYLEAVIDSINARCNVSASTANKAEQHHEPPFGRPVGPSLAPPFWVASHFTQKVSAHSGLCRQRYEVAPIFLIGQVFGSALKRQGCFEKLSVWPGHQAHQFFCFGQVA